jgi:hypothetical protein
MAEYYRVIGEKEKAYFYFSKGQVLKYKSLQAISDSGISIEHNISRTYDSFSLKAGAKYHPPEYLISMVANILLKNNRKEEAISLFKMNLKNYPNSLSAIRDLSTFYLKIGDKSTSNFYQQKILIHDYLLPDSFFSPSFNSLKFIGERFKNISKKGEELVLPPENMVLNFGKAFMDNLQYNEAESFFKLNLKNYGTSLSAHKVMYDFYELIKDEGKKMIFKTEIQELEKKMGTAVTFPIEDKNFDLTINNPVCISDCKVIGVDLAHRNFIRMDRYNPFINLMKNDGYRITYESDLISKQSLSGKDVLLIVAPSIVLEKPEIMAIKEWVLDGGSILAITDHDNSSFDGFLKEFGVYTNEIVSTIDSLHGLLRDAYKIFPSYIVFTKKSGMLGNHPILKGRNSTEEIRTIKTFSGRSIIGPKGSELLKIPSSAIDYANIDENAPRDARIPVYVDGSKTHGNAFSFGKGKVVVISEAAALTAQLFENAERGKIGMNIKECDNKQFALNIMHWLTGYLK